ncbi:hypothetical protein [Vibrio spartinae]|uniref:hypothetical protein n=1 Tax=Vibrio spartinae TaxID=1918945 RepID=UPI00396A1810
MLTGIFYGFLLPPPKKKIAEILGFFAVMFIVMLAFYFLGQWLHNTGHGPKMKAIVDKMRRWPFGRRK